MNWQHLNTAPKEREFLAYAKTWRRPMWVARQADGSYKNLITFRKVIPEMWLDVPAWQQWRKK
jgi:hypothetical protein